MPKQLYAKVVLAKATLNVHKLAKIVPKLDILLIALKWLPLLKVRFVRGACRLRFQ